VQGIEVGHAIEAKHDRLAIDHELLSAVSEGSLSDPWETPGPVIAAARDQAHAITVTLRVEAVAVILDFMEPLRACGHGFAGRRDAKNSNLGMGRI
jgi:hypothetical protein